LAGDEEGIEVGDATWDGFWQSFALPGPAFGIVMVRGCLGPWEPWEVSSSGSMRLLNMARHFWVVLSSFPRKEGMVVKAVGLKQNRVAAPERFAAADQDVQGVRGATDRVAGLARARKREVVT